MSPAPTLPHKHLKHSGARAPRWRVRDSQIHGRGAFCLRPIAHGDAIGIYEGLILSEDQAQQLYGDGAGHTFLFSLDLGRVIDGGQGGNGTRFINHGCQPNVEAIQDHLRIELLAARDIAPGEELLLDYRLQADEPLLHPCRCGAPSCRGTMVWSAQDDEANDLF
jgi:SET domain-containing protein